MKKVALFIVLVISNITILLSQEKTNGKIENDTISNSKETKLKEKKDKKDFSIFRTEEKDSSKAGKKDNKTITKRQNNEADFIKLNDSINRLNKLNDSILKLYDQMLQKEKKVSLLVDSLEMELQNREISNLIIQHFSNRIKKTSSNDFLCRAIMETSLFSIYDAGMVAQSLALAKALGYDSKNHKSNYVFDIYYVLLINYPIYCQELSDNIGQVINQFSKGSINREIEKERFEERLKNSEYYKVRATGEYKAYRHIYWLDLEIEKVRGLFENDKNFKQEKFEEIRKNLNKIEK